MKHYQVGDQYVWTEAELALVQGAYFWGYIVSQIPGGLLCERYGGRHVIAYGLGISGLISLLLPTAGDISVYGVFFIRVLTGLFSVS